jgi:hypothetical protein
MKARWIVAILAAAVIALVAVGKLTETSAHRSTQEGRAGDFCDALDLSMPRMISALQNGSAEKRAVALSTAKLLFSRKYVEGAPDELRGSAKKLRKDLLDLGDGPRNELASTVVEREYRELVSSSKLVCSSPG